MIIHYDNGMCKVTTSTLINNLILSKSIIHVNYDKLKREEVIRYVKSVYRMETFKTRAAKAW